jgi:uncharacterized protein (TIGR03435 family)
VASVKPAQEPTQTKDDYTNGYNAGMRAALASMGLRVVGQRATVVDATLKDLVRLAYAVKDYQIVGPVSINGPKFDIAATLPAGTERAQAPEMLQTLLAQRFHLELHRETRSLPVYALIVAKGGPKLKASAPPSADHRGESFTISPGTQRVRSSTLSMAALADRLTKMSDRPVVDATGLKGNYDIDMTFTTDPAAADAGPPLATALQQAGLRLQKRNQKVEILVIDRADRMPTEN